MDSVSDKTWTALILAAALTATFIAGGLAQRIFDEHQSLYGCVTIKGEKGRNGGGDGGDGIFCRNGFMIMPGQPGQ